MKTLLFLVFFVAFQAFGQTTNFEWDWADQSQGAVESSSYGVATDSQNNIYVVGYICGPTTIGGSVYTPTGNCEAIIIKYSSQNSVQWVKSFTSTGNSYGLNVKVDSNNDIIVVGDYDGNSISYQSATINNQNGGSRDLFLLKIDLNGDLIWLKNIGGSSHDSNTALDVNLSDNSILVGGNTLSSLLTIDGTQLQSKGNYDGFIVKYNSDGTYVWGNVIGGVGNEKLTDVNFSNNGNIYITGNYDADAILIGSTSLTNAGGTDGYLICLDTDGSEIWTKSVSGDADDDIIAVSIDNNDPICLLNFKSSSLTFANTTISNKGNWDGAVIRYDYHGIESWITQIAGSNQDLMGEIKTNSSKKSYVVFNSKSTDLIVGNLSSTYQLSNEVNVCKLDEKGEALLIIRGEGDAYARAEDLCIDKNSKIYLAGYFYASTNQTADFGSTKLYGNNSDYLMFTTSLKETTSLGLINQLESSKSFNLYPNPFQNKVTIETGKPLHFEIRNALGQLILKREIQGVETIELENLTSGVYYISDLENGYTFKMIK